LKLNKGRIADLHAERIFGGEDKGSKNGTTQHDCLHSATCYPNSVIVCPDPSNATATY